MNRPLTPGAGLLASACLAIVRPRCRPTAARRQDPYSSAQTIKCRQNLHGIVTDRVNDGIFGGLALKIAGAGGAFTGAGYGDGVVAIASGTGDGITATGLGTITRPDGTAQLAINGQPLYFYAGDAAPGATDGQGSNSVWWVVAADGTAIKS